MGRRRTETTPALCRDPDRLRPLLWPRPAEGSTGWVSVGQLPKPAARRLRLFGIACARQVSHLFADGDEAALRVSERYADGLADWAELVAVSRPLSAGPPGLSRLVSDCVGWAALGFYGEHPATDAGNFHMAEPFEAARCAARALATEAGRADAFTAARARQAEFIRDLAPPGRAYPALPSWLTSDVLALARGIYAEDAFDRLPILADALQDAGCDTDDVLHHCRDPHRVHVRGCWVVDLILYKT